MCRHTDPMLSQMLPGVRHVRAPLASGAGWLLTAWIVWGQNLPARKTATGLLARAYELANQLGKPIVLAWLGTIAYLVGGAAITLDRLIWRSASTRAYAVESLDTFAAEIDRHRNGPAETPPLRRRARRWVARRLRLRMAAEGPTEWIRANPDIRLWAHIHHARYALRSDVESAEIRWPLDAPDLYNEYDRRKSEMEFNRNVAPPLGGLALATIGVDRTLVTAAISAALLVVAVACLARSMIQARELSKFVLEAQMSRRL